MRSNACHAAVLTGTRLRVSQASGLEHLGQILREYAQDDNSWKHRMLIETLENRRMLSVQPLGGALSIAGTTATTTATVATHPSVRSVSPQNGATGVSRSTFVACDLQLVGTGMGVDATTLKGHVTLVRASDGVSVSGNVNTSGGGDSIVFTPAKLLDANTKYNFKVSSSVKDTGGNTFVSFTSSFTTGTAGGTDLSIRFDKSTTPATGHRYTAVVVGPDHRLYAADDQGDIFRYDLKSDGTLGTLKSIETVPTANKGARLITGLVFDPASTATNLILWVSHGYASTLGSPDFSGKISKLSGTGLKTYQDEIVNLPRSYRDHLTEQMAFGPDGALYISQGSMTAMGAPDKTWGMRQEHLLSGAILRLDVKKLTAKLDVKTKEGGGKYNPFATGAPLTIYADGVRNAYDLVWTHDGLLLSATNGSASGGNTPGGKGTPAETNLTSQHDYLFNIVKGGYYGHPNPLRDEFVMNGGNPTAGVDRAEVVEYPVGTKPDPNYRGFIWDFGKFESPDGTIEYRGKAFNGALDGALMVVQWSGGDNVVVLERNGAKITGAVQDYAGLTGFVDPLDLAEDLKTGIIYVAEYGGKKITLLKPHQSTMTTTRFVKSSLFADGMQTSADLKSVI
jgi:hypothetical protein